MVEKISIQVGKDDVEFVEKIQHYEDLEYSKLETSNFDGQSEVITLVITLTPVVLAFLGKVISEQIRANKSIKIVHKGVSIKGLTAESAIKIIRELESPKMKKNKSK